MADILTPGCPLCGMEPVLVLDGWTQAFCGNDDCTLLCWNPSLSLDDNLSDAGTVQFPTTENAARDAGEDGGA